MHGSLFALDGPAYFAKSTSFALKMFFEIKHYFTFTIKLSSRNTITYSVQVTKSKNLHYTCIQVAELRTHLHVKHLCILPQVALNMTLFTSDGQKPLQVVSQVPADELEVKDVKLKPQERAVHLLHNSGS
jgi:hypothetical protein